MVIYSFYNKVQQIEYLIRYLFQKIEIQKYEIKRQTIQLIKFILSNNNISNKKMTVPIPDHQGIHIRNFFVLFVFISLVAYIHFQLDDAKSLLSDCNSIVKAILRNQTFTINKQKFYYLQQSLKTKSYHQLSQAQCLTRIYLDVFDNQQFLKAEVNNKNDMPKTQGDNQITLDFSQLHFPADVHDLQGFKGCSDIMTLINFLNPTKTDFIYTNFMKQKYVPFIQSQQSQDKQSSNKNHTQFCIISNQFNTSTTKLRQNINSIIDQSYQNYKFVILDNGSTDGSYEIAKVILGDLKQKLIKQNAKKSKEIQQKYKIIKEQSKLGLWELYKKHQNLCQKTDYVIMVDGRDSLPTRHTLNIINHEIIKQKQKPYLITAPILKRKELSRQNPVDLANVQKISNIPTFTFKVIQRDLISKVEKQLLESIKQAKHSFEVEKITIQKLVQYCSKDNKTISQIDEMLYVYDTIQNKQVDRNEYYVSVVKKQLIKGKKDKKKQNKQQTKKL